MDKEKKAYDELCKGIQIAVNSAVDKLPVTKISNAIVVAKDSVEGYNIKLDGILYNQVSALDIGKTFVANQVVVVVIPNGNYNNMFILGGLV